MRTSIVSFNLGMLCISFLVGCQTVGPSTATGGAFGTFAGTLTGAAIGAKEGKAPEGALIGALTGGTLGTLAGNSIDRQIERDRLDIQQRQAQLARAAVSIDQIIQMTQSGLANDVIARQIQNQGVSNRPNINDLIFLKNQGVNDQVIKAFQNAPVASNGSTTRIQQQPIEVIHQPVYYEPCVPAGYGYGYHRPRRRCGPRGGFSVSF